MTLFVDFSDYDPDSMPQRGIHNVRDEFVFRSNPRFIFHDSPGFEAGGEKEFIDVMSFIEYKAKSREVGDQIHMIWWVLSPSLTRLK